MQERRFPAAAIWYAGRWYAPRHRDNWRTLTRLAGVLALGTAVAFLISNGSFYPFSGHFQDVTIAAYAARVTRHLPPYVGYTFMYVLLAAVAHATTVALTGLRTDHSVEGRK